MLRPEHHRHGHERHHRQAFGGDEVALLSLSQGMEEVGSTKTDSQGKFTLKAPADGNVPHMVRVTHGGVSYFPSGGPLMPGKTTAELHRVRLGQENRRLAADGRG